MSNERLVEDHVRAVIELGGGPGNLTGDMMDGIFRRLPVKCANGSIDLIEKDGIFYLEARGEKTLI